MELRGLGEKYLHYKRHGRRLSEDSLRSYRWTTNRFFEWVGPARPVTDLGPDLLREWFHYLCSPRADGVTYRARSVRTTWVITKNFCKWAISTGHIPAFVFPEVELPKLETPHRPRVDDAEITAVLVNLKNEPDPYLRVLYSALVHTLTSTSMRACEITRCCLADIHLDAKDIFIPNGKGGKSGSVPLNDEAIAALRDYLAIRPEKSSKGTDHAFLYANGDPVSRDSLRYRLHKMARAAGFEDDSYFVPHAWRRRGIENIFMQTKDIRAAQQLARHGSIVITEQYLDSSFQNILKHRNKTSLQKTDEATAAPATNAPDTQAQLLALLQSLLEQVAKQSAPESVIPAPQEELPPYSRKRRRDNLRRP